jgi:hypothetical protein
MKRIPSGSCEGREAREPRGREERGNPQIAAAGLANPVTVSMSARNKADAEATRHNKQSHDVAVAVGLPFNCRCEKSRLSLVSQ